MASTANCATYSYLTQYHWNRWTNAPENKLLALTQRKSAPKFYLSATKRASWGTKTINVARGPHGPLTCRCVPFDNFRVRAALIEWVYPARRPPGAQNCSPRLSRTTKTAGIWETARVNNDRFFLWNNKTILSCKAVHTNDTLVSTLSRVYPYSNI